LASKPKPLGLRQVARRRLVRHGEHSAEVGDALSRHLAALTVR